LTFTNALYQVIYLPGVGKCRSNIYHQPSS